MVEGLYALPADRGAQGPSTAERIFGIRQSAASLFGFSYPERVLFTPGATYALNLAIHCGIEDGAHVLTTQAEHNSLLRPLHYARKRQVQFQVLPLLANGRLDLSALKDALASHPQWLALCVASNTLGVLQPIAEACRLAKETGVKVILDMSQGGGQVPLCLDDLGIAYAAVSGHKGLHGPRGIGLLFVGPEEQPRPLVQGGTGTEGTLLQMPSTFPTCLEAGTSNYPGIFGLGAALRYLQAHPPRLGKIRGRLAKLESWARAVPGLDVFPSEPLDWQFRLPLLALRPKRFPAEMMAQFLAQEGVLCRAGSMCTTQVLPALHANDGILRLSPPEDATAEDFARVQSAMEHALLAFA